MFSSFTLRQWLTIPYIVLVLVVALVIGTLSYLAGRNAVDSLSATLLLETVHRIEQAVDRHMVGSSAVLEAAFPTGLRTSERIEGDLEALRQRLWAATSLHTDPNNYVYFANEAGQSVGVFRHNLTSADLRVRHDTQSMRMDYALTGIEQPLPTPVATSRPMDSRLRPWYKEAQTSKTAVWTSVYIDFNTLGLVVTRAKRVLDDKGHLQGVVATDVPLDRLNAFVMSLKISPGSVAFVMEQDGKLIASSKTANVHKLPDGSNGRLSASDAGHAMQAAAFARASAELRRTGHNHESHSLQFDGPDGSPVQMAFSRLQDDSGLDWLVVVAVPQSDFMQGISGNVMRSALIGAGAALAAMGLGMLILNGLSADLQRLTDAAQRVGEGRFEDSVQVRGQGGIATLAKAFTDMQTRLRTDALTGLNNREMIMRAINDRIQRNRRSQDQQPFALLFIDLNQFKQVNDTLGHDAGDKVLIEIGARLRAATRAGDVVARYAGDEFLVMLENVANVAQAEQIRAKVETSLSQPLTSVDLGELTSSFTGGATGIACYAGNAEDAETLVHMADQDMYRRKASA